MKDGGVRDSKWREKLNEQSKQIAFALLGRQLAEPEGCSRSLQMPIATRRWVCLETKQVDHGGKPKQLGPGHVPVIWWGRPSTRLPDPIHYATDTRDWLVQNGMKSDDAKRKGKGRKTDPTGLQENATSNDPVESFTPRQRHERHHIEPESEADYKFLKGWAATTGRKPFWKPARELVRKGHPFPKFSRASLSETGRARRDLEISLDLLGERAERLHQSAQYSRFPESAFEGRTFDGAWARSMGIKRASDLERIKPARVEGPIHARIDFWNAVEALGAKRTPRGYHAPVELKAAVVFYLTVRREPELDLLFIGWRSYVDQLCRQLVDYQPRGWDPVYGRSNRWKGKFGVGSRKGSHETRKPALIQH